MFLAQLLLLLFVSSGGEAAFQSNPQGRLHSSSIRSSFHFFHANDIRNRENAKLIPKALVNHNAFEDKDNVDDNHDDLAEKMKQVEQAIVKAKAERQKLRQRQEQQESKSKIQLESLLQKQQELLQ